MDAKVEYKCIYSKYIYFGRKTKPDARQLIADLKTTVRIFTSPQTQVLSMETAHMLACSSVCLCDRHTSVNHSLVSTQIYLSICGSFAMLKKPNPNTVTIMNRWTKAFFSFFFLKKTIANYQPAM